MQNFQPGMMPNLLLSQQTQQQQMMQMMANMQNQSTGIGQQVAPQQNGQNNQNVQNGQTQQTQARSHRDYASTGSPGDDSKMHVNLWRGSSMSLEWGPYETMQPGHIFTVWPASRAVGMPANPQNINSEYILRTVGANNALKQILNKQATSLKMRHCLHFQTRKLCRLGADCHFIHSKLESEDAAVPQNNHPQNNQGGLPGLGLMPNQAVMNGMLPNGGAQQALLANMSGNNNNQQPLDMFSQLSNNNAAAQQWMLQQQLQQQQQRQQQQFMMNQQQQQNRS